MDNANRYNDIINLPHHVSPTRMPMPPENRAAQFSPFAALTGFEEQILETSRFTDHLMELSEDEKTLLDNTLREIEAHMVEQPDVCVTYFEPDSKKSGGQYVTFTGTLKKIDSYERRLVFFEGSGTTAKSISIDYISSIQLLP